MSNDVRGRAPHHFCKLLLRLFVLLLASSSVCLAQQVRLVAPFPAGFGAGGLVAGKDGVLYGWTMHSGSSISRYTPGKGIEGFELYSSSGKLTWPWLLGALDDGSLLVNPQEGLYRVTLGDQAVKLEWPSFEGMKPYSLFSFTKGLDGNYYAIADQDEEIFGPLIQMSPSGSFTVIPVSSEGKNLHLPNGGLALDKEDGNFYGTSKTGGAVGSIGEGAIYRITSQGEVTILHSFVAAGGANPMRKPLIARDGGLYGLTFREEETLYRFDRRSQKLAVLHRFPYGSSAALSELVEGYDGNIYGLFVGTGCDGQGCIYRVDRFGRFAIIHKFNDSDEVGTYSGGCAQGLVVGSRGVIYGTTGRAIYALDLPPTILSASCEGVPSGAALTVQCRVEATDDMTVEMVNAIIGGRYGVNVPGPFGKNTYISEPVTLDDVDTTWPVEITAQDINGQEVSTHVELTIVTGKPTSTPLNTPSPTDPPTPVPTKVVTVTATPSPTASVAPATPTATTSAIATATALATRSNQPVATSTKSGATKKTGTPTVTTHSSPTASEKKENGPKVLSKLRVSCRVNEPLHFKIVVANGPANFSATKLPKGLRLNKKSGVLRGRLNRTGLFRMRVRVSNDTGNTTVTFRVRVR